jgi:hypothetical protein
MQFFQHENRERVADLRAIKTNDYYFGLISTTNALDMLISKDAINSEMNNETL